MWQPEPGWRPMGGGGGPSTYGVWLATVQGREVVVKRLLAPDPGDPVELREPRSPAYWRREVEVALHGTVRNTPGLRGAPVVAVEEDDEGATLVTERVERVDNPGLFLARALGRFATSALPEGAWLARGQLAARLGRVERAGGWRTLGRTTVADVADRLWSRRAHFLAALDEGAPVLQHGDPVPANLPGRLGAHDVVALDWSGLGLGPLGADLGLLALVAREGFEPLLRAYLDGYSESAVLTPQMREQALLGARVSAVYTALSRAEWALARVASGEGALAGKFRHPSVAPHLHALQRQAPQVEALL